MVLNAFHLAQRRDEQLQGVQSHCLLSRIETFSVEPDGTGVFLQYIDHNRAAGILHAHLLQQRGAQRVALPRQRDVQLQQVHSLELREKGNRT